MNHAQVRRTTQVIQLDQQKQPEPRRQGSRILPVILRALLPLAVLALGWLGYSILSVEPEQAKLPETKARTIKTRAVELHVQDFPTTIETRGVIRAHNEVMLMPQVSGRIMRILPEFEDGAFFAAGDVLVELDPEDLAGAVIMAEAQLARAISSHAQEQIRAKQARLNWDDLGYEGEPSDLALRLPQLREAEANVKSATAQLNQAQRNLERAKVRAPFDGRVRQRTVGLGQSVGPGSSLGSVFAVDFAEVRLPISARDMAFLTLPEGPEDAPVDVQLRDTLDETSDTVWTAKIIRTEGTLDRNSLELFAIARISDPFARESEGPPLRIGQPVLASIPGHVLKDVIALPVGAVRQLDQIVLLEPNEPNGLTINSHRIEIIWKDEAHVIVRDPNITDGALLATTHLIYAPEGSEVEILPDPNVATDSATDAESLDKADKTE
jgi:RND family efflux transporter MFP subunit